MKKLIAVCSILLLAVGVFAQTRPTEVAPNDYISDPSEYFYIWGSASDTLTNADTLNFVFRVRGDFTRDIEIKLYSDHVSGTAGGTLIGYKSIDGVNYEASGDTITVSSLTGDAMDSEVIDLPDFLWPYFKLVYIQSGTAVTVPKAYVIARRN